MRRFVAAVLACCSTSGLNAQDAQCALGSDLDSWRTHLCYLKTDTLPDTDDEGERRAFSECLATELSLDSAGSSECELKQDYLSRTCAALDAGNPDEVSRCLAEGFVQPPLPLDVRVRYEPGSKKSCVGGYAELDFTVLADGTVANAQVIDASQRKIFDRAALDSIERSRFVPQRRNHVPEDARSSWRMEFPPSDADRCRKDEATVTLLTELALEALGLTAEDVEARHWCMVSSPVDSAQNVAKANPKVHRCMLVRTQNVLHFVEYSYARGTYVVVGSFPNAEITGVALKTFGLNRQIHLHRGDELTAFHVVGSAFVDTDATSQIFDSLIAAGIAPVEPKEWVNLLEPGPTMITIPIYIPN